MTPHEPERPHVDGRLQSLVLLASAVTAAVTTRSTLPAHHWWGRIAFVGYVVAALVANSPARRWWPMVAVLGAGIVPLVVLVVGRSRGWHHVAQSEVDVIEAAARRLIHHGTPYLDPSAMSSSQRITHYSYVPYLPPLSIAGLPRAVFGTSAWTDARVWLGVADVVLWAAIWRRCAPRSAQALALVAASPLVTLPMAVGGHDVVIVSLLVLGALGVTEALGGAAGLTYLAWPLALPLARQPQLDEAQHRRRSRRSWWRAPAIAAVGALPILVDPHAAYENLVLFPLGRTPARSPADAPSIGHLLARVSGGKAIDLVALGLTVLAIGWLTLVDPPDSTSTALMRAAIGFTVLIALVPSTRVGYLLYPVAFWSLARTLDSGSVSARRPGRATSRSATRSGQPSPRSGR